MKESRKKIALGEERKQVQKEQINRFAGIFPFVPCLDLQYDQQSKTTLLRFVKVSYFYIIMHSLHTKIN